LILDWQDTTDPEQDPLTYTVFLAKDDPGLLDNPYTDDAPVIRKEMLGHSACLLTAADGLEDLSTYYWKVQAVDAFGSLTDSTSIRMFRTNNANPVYAPFDGYIASQASYEPIPESFVAVSGITIDTGLDGYFLASLDLPDGAYDVAASAPGYISGTQQVYLAQNGDVQRLIFLLTPGAKLADINGDDQTDLADVILALKVMSGIPTDGGVRSDYGGSGADVNGDGQAGHEEVIYAIQILSGTRTE
jgi:hypothetical protein